MNVLISGGCKNGKSDFAQELALRLAGGGRRYYVATMVPHDGEDRARIARHIDNRAGMGFETIERGTDIAGALADSDTAGTFLVDSVTSLLLNEMFSGDHAGDGDPAAAARCIDGLTRLADGAANAVFVTDYIYSDAARYDAFTEGYRAALASIDRALARRCETVVELCAGNVIVHKGALPV